jgi:hypothetical protein
VSIELNLSDMNWCRQRIAELEAYNATRTDEMLAATIRIAELEAQVELSQTASRQFEMLMHKQAENIGKIEEQRDELLAALEQFATWGRMQHKAQSKGCHATFDRMALRDEIELAEAAIASVKGETS